MAAPETHIPSSLMGAESLATARSSWNHRPFLMHHFSLGDPTSLSPSCRPQFFLPVYDKYTLIRSLNIDPAPPLSHGLFKVPGSQPWARWVPFSSSGSQRSSRKRHRMARGSSSLAIHRCTREDLKLDVYQGLGPNPQPLNQIFWESVLGTQFCVQPQLRTVVAN